MKSLLTQLFIFSVIFAQSALGESLTVEIDEPVHRVGIAFSGGLAKETYETHLKSVPETTVYSEGGSDVRSQSRKDIAGFQCTKSTMALSNRVEFECVVFANHLEVTANPTSISIIKGDRFFQTLTVKMDRRITPHKNAVNLTTAGATSVDGVILQGDFAENIFTEFLSEEETRRHSYSNGVKESRSKGDATCSKTRLIPIDSEVKTKFECGIRNITEVKVTPLASTMNWEFGKSFRINNE